MRQAPLHSHRATILRNVSDKEMCSIQLLCIVAFSLSVFCNTGAQQSTTIYISNNTSRQENSFTLDSYVIHSQTYRTESNTTLVFHTGIHLLSHNLTFRNIAGLTLKLQNKLETNHTLTSTIQCTDERSTIAFVNITDLTIDGLTIFHCGAEIGEKLSQDAMILQTRSIHLFDKRLKVAVFAINIWNLNIQRVNVFQSAGYGLLAVNILGNSLMNRSVFDSNNKHTHTAECWNRTLTAEVGVKCQGGNAVFLFADTPQCSRVRDVTLIIQQSRFLRGLDWATSGYSQTYVGSGSGLGVILSQFRYGVHVRLESVLAAVNTAKQGANLYLRVFNYVTNSSLSIVDSISFGGNAMYQPPTQGYFNILGSFSGVFYLYGAVDNSLLATEKCTAMMEDRPVTRTEPTITRHENILTIEKCHIRSNFGLAGAGMTINAYTSINQDEAEILRYVTIRNTTVSKNRADLGSGLLLYDVSSSSVNEPVKFTLDNVHVDENIPLTTQVVFEQDFVSELADFISNLQQQSTVTVNNIKNLVVKNCKFTNNNLSALSLFDSSVIIEGQNLFQNNRALNGAGMYLTQASVAYIRPNTSLIFQNNHAASRGGAVYVSSNGFVAVDLSCPFQVLDPSLLLVSDLNINVKFIDNSAVESGDAFYGGHLDKCLSSSPSGFFYHNSSLMGREFDFISDLEEQPSTDSIISSDASDVCFCFEGKHNCSVNTISREQYPGEAFTVSVVGVGQRGGTTPTITRAFLTVTNEQSLQRTGRTCSNNVYRAKSHLDLEYIFIYTQGFSDVPRDRRIARVDIRMLRPCPTGFGFNDYSRICDCDVRLAERNMTCDIDSRIITRSPPYWISNYSDYLLLHDHCPFDYCKETTVQVILREPNVSGQCAFNRYGRLCGQCEEGYSAVFGTSRCLICSDSFLSLIVLFGTAGALLVVFLLVLDMTVAVGSINGLIFYANIFKINEAIFLSPGDRSILKVFISWVNLDLGIETCFYNGMDSYSKTWLQIVFPLYLWLLLFAIIIGSRYSSLVFRVFGTHSVSVLATIFLLSYTKLLRVIITALSFTTLTYPDGDRWVWLYDGHIDFGRERHAALVLFAVLLLVTVAIPYSFLILFIQLLRLYSDKSYLKWVTKFMPIFDAYLGPYKSKHGYWTGLLLLVRVALAAILSFNVAGDPAVNVLVITITTVLITTFSLSFGGMYKDPFLTALELSFVLNLGGLSVVTGYNLQTGGRQNLAGYVSISIVFLTFIIISLHHLHKRVTEVFKKIRRHRKINSTQSKGQRSNDRSQSPEVVELTHTNVTTTVIDVIRSQHPDSDTNYVDVVDVERTSF